MDKDKLEKLANQIQKECEKDGEPVTIQEALEMAEMELKAKENCKHYETSTKERKTVNRTKQIDNEKIELIKFVAQNIDKTCLDVSNIIIKNDQKEITFSVGENDYSITLTKHRKK